ncbi:heterokaryon incompatibility protein-domain-containing protein, partial [Lasiosphaeris hirsuta]
MWLGRCLARHALCSVSTLPDPKLPTRVLDVGIRGNPEEGIRLVDGKNCRGPYVALSHVWGRSRVITTQISNIEQRHTGISLESLSKTFRDAVHAARQLLVPYLWIDSLCIIQDSGVDWSAEAAKMGEYYANAMFTISAVSASSGHCGIF